MYIPLSCDILVAHKQIQINNQIYKKQTKLNPYAEEKKRDKKKIQNSKSRGTKGHIAPKP